MSFALDRFAPEKRRPGCARWDPVVWPPKRAYHALKAEAQPTKTLSLLLPLLLPLYYPLAMRVATDHILGKFEGEIWIQSFGSAITPSLMPYAASIEVNA